MFHVALYQPEIPPNTGNIIRLCANTGAHLHLIHPLAFNLEQKQLRRAGLDYRDLARISQHQDYANFITTIKPARVFACTTKGQTNYASVGYQRDDVLLFGPETRGLPDSLLAEFNNKQKIRIPMQSHSRSLNLSNAVAIILFEAWRQHDFQ